MDKGKRSKTKASSSRFVCVSKRSCILSDDTHIIISSEAASLLATQGFVGFDSVYGGDAPTVVWLIKASLLYLSN